MAGDGNNNTDRLSQLISESNSGTSRTNHVAHTLFQAPWPKVHGHSARSLSFPYWKGPIHFWQNLGNHF